MVICLEQSANDLHMVQLMPLPSLLQKNAEWFILLSFWYQPTRIVLEKRLLNDCVCIPKKMFLYRHDFQGL